MRIMDSSVRMASVNLSYRKSSYSGSSFMQNMSDFSKRQEGNGEEDGIRSRAVGAANRARKVRAGGEM